MTYTPDKVTSIVEEYMAWFKNQHNALPSESQVMRYVKLRTKYPYNCKDLWEDIWFKWDAFKSASFLKNYFFKFGFKNPKIFIEGMNPLQNNILSYKEKKDIMDFISLF